MRKKLNSAMLVMVLGLLWVTGSFAQQENAPPAQFGITGFIQEATVANVGSNPGTDPQLYGGTLTVNGIKMIVPNNSIIQMPAFALSWAQLFDPALSASVGYDPPRPNHRAGMTGLALADDPLAGTRAANSQGWYPFPSCEVSVVGNVLTDSGTGVQTYIVGLIVPVEQQVLNGTGGLINYIDYATGRFRVGGVLNDPTTGKLVEINDPVGRHGKAHSPDPRFTCDTSWPTISTSTGYPVGIPRVAPPDIDPDCPITNRPVNGQAGFPIDPFLASGAPLRTFTMPASPQAGFTAPDPWKMVPLMVGDWVDYSGTLFKINPFGPNTPENSFVSIHTLTAHLGIKTAPGTTPAYIRVEGFIFGVGDTNNGPIVNAGNPPQPIRQESSTRVGLGVATTNSDPNLPRGNPALPTASVFAIVVDPTTGAESEVLFPNGNGATNPEIAIDDPIRGRLRWQISKNLTPGGVEVSNGPPFTREYIVKLSTGQVQLPTQANGLPGLSAGEYRLPIFEYIFTEGTNFGEPIPPNNFQDFGFLAQGCGPLGGEGSGGPVIGPLDPFPGVLPLAPLLAAPVKGTPAKVGATPAQGSPPVRDIRTKRAGTRKR